MPELLFALDGAFNHRAHSVLTQYNSREHFRCEPLPLSDDGRIHMRVEKSPNLPNPVAVHTTWSRYALRRTQSHIRHDRSNACIVLAVDRGSIKLAQRGAVSEAEAGTVLIIPLGAPYHIEFIPDEECHRAIFALFPIVELQRYFPAIDQLSALLVKGGTSAAAGKILEFLFWEGEEMDGAAFRAMADAILVQLAANFGQGRLKKPSIHDQHFAAIGDYLRLHMATPGLSLAEVSNHFGFSIRYITKLFRRHDSSFARTLWSMRLERVRELLQGTEHPQRSIAEFAFEAGFKSAPHLSTMFQKTFGVSPRDYRKEMAEVKARPLS